VAGQSVSSRKTLAEMEISMRKFRLLIAVAAAAASLAAAAQPSVAMRFHFIQSHPPKPPTFPQSSPFNANPFRNDPSVFGR